MKMFNDFRSFPSWSDCIKGDGEQNTENCKRENQTGAEIMY